MNDEYVIVLNDKDPHLRAKSADVKTPLSKKDQKVMEGLIKYITDSRDPEKAEKYNLQPASGLAAPQIGVNKKMIAVIIEADNEDGESKFQVTALVNPKITSYSEQYSYLENGEGCLSVQEEHQGYVPRHARITVEAYDYFQKKKVSFRARGYYAIVLQHEIDHLNGILFYDHINAQDPWHEIKDAIVIE